MKKSNRLVVRLAAVGAVSTLLVMAACSFETGAEDDDSGTGKADAGKDSTATGDGGIPIGAGTCAKYGGPDTVKKVVADALAAVKSDCRISRSFAGLDAARTLHVRDCLEIQFSELLQCDGAVAYTGSKDSKGTACRSMTEAHKNSNISLGDFDAFTEDVVSALQANGVEQGDISAIASQLGRTSTQIVRNNSTAPTRLCDASDPVDANDGGRDGARDGGDGGGNGDGGGDGGGTTDSGNDSSTTSDTGTTTDSGGGTTEDSGSDAAGD